MTKEDQKLNVKICKILGIEPFEECYDDFGLDPTRLVSIDYVGLDYCNDLNAMQKVWDWCRQVTGTEHPDSLHWEGIRSDYGEKLNECANKKRRKNGGAHDYILANLTAREKAECFIKAMRNYEI